MHSIVFNETFWVAVSIILILAIIYKYCQEPLKHYLNTKAAVISNKIDEAMTLQSDAEKMLKDQQKLYIQFTQQAKDILAMADSEVELLQKQARDDFAEKIKHKSQVVKKNIYDTEVRLLRKLRLQAVQNSILICAEILSNKESGAAKAKLLDEALKAAAVRFAA